jgi:hypothetical protein
LSKEGKPYRNFRMCRAAARALESTLFFDACSPRQIAVSFFAPYSWGVPKSLSLPGEGGCRRQPGEGG